MINLINLTICFFSQSAIMPCDTQRHVCNMQSTTCDNDSAQ